MEKERKSTLQQARIRTGIFSGSFNPIHIGHLALANYLCEYDILDEVWFLVTPHNPLKKESELWDDNFRLELVKLAIDDYPKFRVSDYEFHLPDPSYTITTLDALQQEYPDRTFALIIGSDNWKIFSRWHQPEQILSRYHLLIYPRLGFDIDESALPRQVRFVKAPIFEMSSTIIREAIETGKDVRYFLHPAVYEKIKKMFHDE